MREEGDDADGHRHREAAATGLLLASCSDRSRVRLRPPAGATPSPRPCSAHVTATERPRGRGRRGPGRAGCRARGGAGARCGGGLGGAGRPASLLLPDRGAEPAGLGWALRPERGRAWPSPVSLFLPLRNGLLPKGYCLQLVKASPLRTRCGDCAVPPQLEAAQGGAKLLREGARIPSCSRGRPGARQCCCGR